MQPVYGNLRYNAPVSTDYRWLVLVWRLPTGISTPRVTAWRRLKRLGAAPLTPGAAVVAYSEENHEQLDWIAEDITDWGGDAWVLPVGELPRQDEARIRRLTWRRRTRGGAKERPAAAALRR